MRPLIAFLALVFAATLQAAPATRIMQLGDSLTAQPEARKFLFEKLTADGCTFEFVGSQGEIPLRHEGHGAYTIGPDNSEPGNIFANIGEWIPAAQPDIITVLIGNNDYNGKPGVDPATAPERMAVLLDQLHALAPDATILVSSVLKIAAVDDYAGQLNRALPDIVKAQQAAGHRVHYVDLHTEVDLIKGEPPYQNPGGDYTDGTHLNESGASKLAEGWFTHLRPLLKP